MDTAEKYNMPEPVELTEAAQMRLKKYPWPGNVRQLKNLTEQISILSPERVITPEVLDDYVPDTLVSHDIVPLKKQQETHSFENEREILYKILFDLRNDVMELKKQMQGQRTGAEVKGVSLHPTTQDHPITYYRQDVSYPAERTAKSEDDFQTPEEYVEESLSLEDWERQMIIKALEKNHGKRKSAAHDLKISERTLYRKIKEYGLDKEYDE
jgi:DNA-binding NtrC family response regulator